MKKSLKAFVTFWRETCFFHAWRSAKGRRKGCKAGFGGSLEFTNNKKNRRGGISSTAIFVRPGQKPGRIVRLGARAGHFGAGGIGLAGLADLGGLVCGQQLLDPGDP